MNRFFETSAGSSGLSGSVGGVGFSGNTGFSRSGNSGNSGLMEDGEPFYTWASRSNTYLSFPMFGCLSRKAQCG